MTKEKTTEKECTEDAQLIHWSPESGFICAKCGKSVSIFGKHEGEAEVV